MKVLHIGQMIGGLDIYIRNSITFASGSLDYVIMHGKDDYKSPIYCNGNYIRADSIKKGDVVYEMQSLWCRNSKGQLHEKTIEIQKQIDTNKTRQCGNGNIVYNIGVEDNHNYFVNDILVHNCHRVSTNPQSIQMFRSCIDYFAARYRIGLTATVHRADGLADCIKLIIGDIIYQIEKSDNEYVCRYESEILLRFPIDKFQVPAQIEVIETNYNLEDKDVYSANGGTIQFATLISDLAMNEDRNKLIVDQLRKIEGSTLVLSDRVEQLKYLCSQVENGVQIDGGTPKKQREKALKDVDEGKKKYLFASYSLAKEGLSLNILSNLVMATPVKDFAIVSQSIGRIQRPYEGKTIAKVYDFVDDVGMLMVFYTKRRSTYRKNKWKIENIYLERGR